VKIFGFEIARTKAAGGDLVTHFPGPSQWFPIIRESFAGAWQRGIITPVEDALSHPTFWACVTLIASDVAKCRPKLVREDADGIETEVDNPAYSPVLRRPNHYQNRIQFYIYWILSKLCRGAAIALKERDARGVITALYLLDPTRVRPMVTPSGDVYYALQQDVLAGVTEASVLVPAREIIADIAFAPYHPLCWVSPIYACGHATMQSLTIINNATRLFKRGLPSGGILTAPGNIGPDDAKKLEDWWTANYTGEENIGKVAVLGGGLKFEKPTAMSFVDAQLIEQLKWDDEKICAVLHVPPYKVSVGPIPSYNNVEALGQEYYGDCLQIHFESLELCLTEGLELKTGYEVEFDLDALNRMDSVQKMEAATKGVVGGVYSPNEARAKFNLKPVKGGDTPYLQQQNYSLAALDARDQAGPAAHAQPTPGLPSPKPVGELPPAPNPPKPPAKAAIELDEDELLAAVLKGLAVAA
jgi:HK97 family phage portal protein